MCGSTMIFHDNYLEKEQNRRLLVSHLIGNFRFDNLTLFFKDVVVEFLTNPSFRLNDIDAEVPDVRNQPA